MGRREKSSPAEDILAIASKLPWWGATALAVISYSAMHAYATEPIAISMVPGQMSAAVLPMFFKGLATVAQYVLPLLFTVAAVMSCFKQKKPAATPTKPARLKPRAVPEAAPQITTCPSCAASMVLRSAKRGNNAGKSFWGCTNYPRCKGTRPAD